jgi:hypothetical protein
VHRDLGFRCDFPPFCVLSSRLFSSLLVSSRFVIARYTHLLTVNSRLREDTDRLHRAPVTLRGTLYDQYERANGEVTRAREARGQRLKEILRQARPGNCGHYRIIHRMQIDTVHRHLGLYVGSCACHILPAQLACDRHWMLLCRQSGSEHCWIRCMISTSEANREVTSERESERATATTARSCNTQDRAIAAIIE